MLSEKEKAEVKEALIQAIEDGRVIEVGDDFVEGHNAGAALMATAIEPSLRRLEAEMRIVKAIIGREHFFDKVEGHIADIRYFVDNPPRMS